MVDVAPLLAAALAHPRAVPEPLARGAAALGAEVAGRVPGAHLDQLRRNLARARPGLGAAELDRLARENLRRYLRYYAEMLTLGRLSRDEVLARVRVRGLEHVTGAVAQGRTVVGALGHLGNWDLAGAYIAALGVRTVTVAEHLEPEEVFAGFLRVREGLGLTIVPLERSGTLRRLVRESRAAPSFVPLLADRDLSRQGVTVDLLGEPARVAPGPAALARALRAPLVTVAVHHERLAGARARAAGFRSGAGWGIVASVVPVDTGGDVEAVTRRWAARLGEAIAARPADWHMMQPVWEADVEPTP